MMKITLTKHETLWQRGGPVFASGEVTRYRVGSMPPGNEALINNFGAPNRNDWQIRRTSNGVSGNWTGHFECANKALAEIQRQIEVQLSGWDRLIF